MNENQSFMYPIPEELLRPNNFKCIEGDMFYSEVLIPKLLDSTPYITNDPNEANYFLVPQHIACCYHHCLRQGVNRYVCSNRTQDYITDILRHIQGNYPFWNISKGTDHIFVFCWGRGYGVMGQDAIIRSELQNSIHLTTFGKVYLFYFFI